jgi:hypothetical protein
MNFAVIRFEAESGAKINPGAGELLKGMRPLLTQLKDAGYESIRILAERKNGANPELRDITISLK